MRGRSLLPVLLLGGCCLWGQSAYKGTLARLDLTSRVTRACPTPTTQSTTASLPLTAQDAVITSNYTCPSVEIAGPPAPVGGLAGNGTVLFTLPAEAVKARVTPGQQVVVIDPPPRFEVEAGFKGTATLLSAQGTPRPHNFWVDLKVEGLPQGANCPVGSTAREIRQVGDSASLDTTTRCSLGGLIASTLIPAAPAPPPSEFEASFVISAVVDSGHVGVRCCAERGGKYEFLLRVVYKFVLDEADLRNQTSQGKPRIPVDYKRNVKLEHYLAKKPQAGLDSGCRFGIQGDLVIQVPITRYVGEVNGEGYLANPEELVRRGGVTESAYLRLAVYDVDSDVPETADRKPERDIVTVNGRQITRRDGTTHLRGVNNLWALNTFLVPIKDLKFPRLRLPSPVQAADNEIRIKIDDANRDRNQWCMEVDWASISFSAMAPVVLIHGAGESSGDWTRDWPGRDGNRASPIDTFRRAMVPHTHAIELDSSFGPAERNGEALAKQLPVLANAFGVEKLHLVGFDKGAIDARAMFGRYAGRFLLNDTQELRILSLFAIGTANRGSVYWDFLNNATAPLGNVSALLEAVLRAAGGAAVSVNSAITSSLRSIGEYMLSAVGVKPYVDSLTQTLNTAEEAARPRIRFVLSLVDSASDAVTDFVFYEILGRRRPGELRASERMTVKAMEEFNRNHRKPPWINYYSIAGDADKNANQMIDLASEVEDFLILPRALDTVGRLDLTRLLVPVSNIRYQAIGSLARIGILDFGSAFGSTSFVGLDIPQTPAFRRNDLFVPEDSVHCVSPCGFVSLGTLPYHHYALRSPEVIDLVISTIRKDFPLAQ